MKIDISVYASDVESQLRTGIITLTEVDLERLMEEIVYQVEPEDLVDCFDTEFLEKMLNIRQAEEREELAEQAKLQSDYNRAVGARL